MGKLPPGFKGNLNFKNPEIGWGKFNPKRGGKKFSRKAQKIVWVETKVDFPCD